MMIDKQKHIWKYVQVMLLCCIPVLFSCENSIKYVNESQPEIEQNVNRIHIVDITGEKWDITHAVNKYGFKPHLFQHGLGKNAISPIIEPEFIHKNDLTFPDDTEEFLMIGVSLRGESRAYPIVAMIAHEIVDDIFIDTHVAVAY